jgi:hypothetical protein
MGAEPIALKLHGYRAVQHLFSIELEAIFLVEDFWRGGTNSRMGG